MDKEIIDKIQSLNNNIKEIKHSLFNICISAEKEFDEMTDDKGFQEYSAIINVINSLEYAITDLESAYEHLKKIPIS